ncbi:MAG: PEGA domain-containing protein [Sandaracinaceae bacterium]|nr:PEGA domain-containing protein [Sandaracinaceae bacterium]
MRPSILALSVMAATLSFGADAHAEITPDQPLAHACDGTTVEGRICLGLRAAREGRWQEAEATLDAVRLVEDRAVAAQTGDIEVALAQAREHLGSLDVRCAPPGATISVDGAPRGMTPLERPLRLEVGEHDVTCSADDHDAASQHVSVAARAFVSIELSPTPHDHRPVLERAGDPGEAQRIVGIGALSLGGVSLAIGLGTLFAGLDATPPDREPFFDVARGTLIAGGVLVVAGIVLVLTAE